MQDDPIPERLGEVDAVLRQQTIIADFGTHALHAHDLDELLGEACRLAAQGLSVEHAKILQRQPDAKRLLVRAGVGWSEGVVGNATLGDDVESPAGYALQTGWPTVAEDLVNETRFRIPELLRQHSIRSALNVIIRGEGAPYGVLEIDHTAPRAFQQHDVNFLQSFANLLAAAIERIRVQRALEELVAEKTKVARQNEILLRELHHRVNNNLSQIASLVRLQRSRAASAEVGQALSDIEARLSAMMLLYRSLTITSTSMTVALGGYLEDVAESVRRISGASEVEIQVQPTDLVVHLDVAVPLGLIVNEFITNSLKYAFPGRRGTISVGLQRPAAGSSREILLTLHDNGVGMSAPNAHGKGLGISLITRLANQLGGRAEWPKGPGTRLDCYFPVERADQAAV